MQSVLPKRPWVHRKSGANHTNLLNKCDGDGTDHYLALLQLTTTPIDSIVLMGRVFPIHM